MNILKKKMTLVAFAYVKLWTPKMWLNKCLKCPVSEAPSTSNMVNGLKHCWNMHHSTFIIFIDHCQGNWIVKSLSFRHAKSWESNFENAEKNSEKVFSFWDHCISIGTVKFSLLRAEYLPSAANVLTSSPKIWHANKADFLQLNFLGSNQ